MVRDACRADDPLGRAVAGGPDPAAIRPCSPSCRGGSIADLRVDCAGRLAALDFPGYAVGGLSVGEEPAEMYRVLDVTVPALPADRPRYLMGVGRPQDLLEAIRPGHRPVRLRAADAQRPQRLGLYRRRADPAAQPANQADRPAAGGRLSLPGVPAQPRLSGTLFLWRNAGAGAGQPAQPDYYQRLLVGCGRRSPRASFASCWPKNVRWSGADAADGDPDGPGPSGRGDT